jgi:U3 small nucleolar RNA-associated protein 4
MIFSSGVDRKTMRYQRLPNGKWVHVDGKTYHKHDVRAIASFESSETRMICSGGVDRSLSVLFFNNGIENLRVLPPVPQARVVKLAREARILLSWQDNHVRLWRVEEIANHEFAGDQIENRYLLEMEFKHEENISTAAISPNGEYLLIATLTFTKLFSLTSDEATSRLTVDPLGEFPHGARLATFTPSGDKIMLVTQDSEVQIHPFLDPDAMTAQFPFIGDRGSHLTSIAVSPDGETFACASSTSMVLIQSFNTDVPPIMFPQPSTAITSLAFLTPALISVTLADRNRLLLFELKNQEWTLHPWCKNADNMPMQIGITVDKCQGTFIANNDTSRIWMWGANWLAWIQPTGPKSAVKRPNDVKDDTKQDVQSQEYPHWISYRYREVLLVDCLESTPENLELVVVERPRHEILEDITEPRFYRHEYGT